MKHIDIENVLQDKTLLGSTVTVCGWVRTSRESAAVTFLEVTDGTSFTRLQVVVDKSKLALDPECTKCGASIAATGVVVKAFKGEGAELNAESVRLLGKCPGDYPIQKKRTTLEFLRGIPHLRLRTNTFSAVFRVRSVAAQAIHRYFHSHRFYYVHTPLITASACEGAGEMFRVTTQPWNAKYDARRPITAMTSSAGRRGFPCRDSSRAKSRRWRWAGSTRSGRPSAPRTPTRRVTLPSSGTSSPRSHLRNFPR